MIDMRINIAHHFPRSRGGHLGYPLETCLGRRAKAVITTMRCLGCGGSFGRDEWKREMVELGTLKELLQSKRGWRVGYRCSEAGKGYDSLGLGHTRWGVVGAIQVVEITPACGPLQTIGVVFNIVCAAWRG